jgi:hypothetical protein
MRWPNRWPNSSSLAASTLIPVAFQFDQHFDQRDLEIAEQPQQTVLLQAVLQRLPQAAT